MLILERKSEKLQNNINLYKMLQKSLDLELIFLLQMAQQQVTDICQERFFHNGLDIISLSRCFIFYLFLNLFLIKLFGGMVWDIFKLKYREKIFRL